MIRKIQEYWRHGYGNLALAILVFILTLMVIDKMPITHVLFNAVLIFGNLIMFFKYYPYEKRYAQKTQDTAEAGPESLL